MNNDHFIKQATEIINEFSTLKRSSQYHDLSDLDDEKITKLITQSKSFVARSVGIKSEYYKDIQSALEKKNLCNGTQLNYVIGSVAALKEDLTNDYLKSFTELLHSDLFSSYIDIARHLLESGHKDSAAVIVGSTLESHLRKMCEKFNIEIEIDKGNGKIGYKSADRMNADLGKDSAITLGLQKQITAWLEIRNNAAHGKYTFYSDTEVKIMIMGVENFILNNPA